MEHGLRFPGPMELFDLAIVYMSLGAPIGVYRYFQIRGDGQVPRLFRAAAVWLLWPLAAFILLTRIFRKKRFITQIAAPFDLDATLKRRQRELIRALSSTMEPRKVFEVRSAVERYGGLTSAALLD